VSPTRRKADHASWTHDIDDLPAAARQRTRHDHRTLQDFEDFVSWIALRKENVANTRPLRPRSRESEMSSGA
jgi:hypothetical protein